MTQTVAFVEPVEEEATAMPDRGTRGRPKPAPTDSNMYTDRAKKLVVDNYNEHHDSGRTPPLTTDHVYVLWFSKVLDNWQAIIGSTVVKGLLYEVTHNGLRKETYVDVYKKINNVKVPD